MKLLAAIDGSQPYTQKVLEWACKLVHSENDEIIIIVVVEEFSIVDLLDDESILVASRTVTQENEKLHSRAIEILEDATKQCANQSCSIKTKIVISNARDGILEAASSNQVDMIILGSRGLGTVKRLLLGSVSEFISQHATCPVLVVRAPPSNE